ncbi:MAG: pseudaminic acid cytidylyltransferase [Deltaproteobacteria bacterium]|nr:pseudaminic acid cytidylyltransferase [Deltaproteobacteria bacterium]
MIAAIIPARGGSKRIPDKNIKPFGGKPIISYSIESAKETGVFDKIIVSTDSEEIANVAKRVGAEVPFLRPAELADDFIPTAPVLMHAIQWLLDRGMDVKYFCCIYATAPFIHPKYIKEGFDLMMEKGVSSVFSVTTYAFPIHRSLKLNEKENLEMFWPEYEMVRSQDLPEAYHDAGQFYWLETTSFLKGQKIYTSDAMPVILPRYLVQDMDTLEDWETAERMFKAHSLGQ